MKLSDALAAFLRAKVAQKRSPATLKDYERTLRLLINWLGPDCPVDTVTPEDLDTWVCEIRAQGLRYVNHPSHPIKQGGLSDASLAKYLRTVRTFFNWLVRREHLAKSPARFLEVPTRKGHSVKAAKPEGIAALYDAAYRSKTPERDQAMVLFLADTGCRAGGLCSLTRENLDLERMSATIHEKGGKEVKVFFGEETAEALHRYLSIRPDTVGHDHVFVTRFGKPFTSNGLYQVFSRLSKRAGLTHVTGPHSIRHRVGQAWADAGLPVTLVQQKLGHSDPNTTLWHYFNQDEERLRDASQGLTLLAIKKRPSLRLVRKGEGKEDTKATDDTAQEAVG